MKLADAAAVYADTTRQIKVLDAQRTAAADVLKEHFRSGGKPVYRGWIGYAISTYVGLDTAKVKAELADRLDEFQVTRSRETLSILK